MRAKKGFRDEETIPLKKETAILDLVVKADTAGTMEAVVSGLDALQTGDVTVEVIRAGTGDISKSDLLMAETGNSLVVGFNVGLVPRIAEEASERGIEIRLYDVIYKIIDDVKEITQTMIPPKEEEMITGRARVIALFPGGRKGIILGCEVLEGTLAIGKKFRLISEPGTVYEGTIDSLHIETKAVKEATPGQQVGLKIAFKRAKKGDLVECFEISRPSRHLWRAEGRVLDLRSGRS
ncbi:MAG: hypothetical protein ACOWYE_14635 [Desulfatiglandales bacterium]